MKFLLITAFIFPPLLLTALQQTGELSAPANDRTLDLTKVDTVRVLLYDNNPPEKILLKALETDVTLTLGEESITLEPHQIAEVNLEGAVLTVMFGGDTIRGERIEAESSGGLTQLITDQFGYRQYRGRLQITPDNRNGLRVLNHVPLEDYISSVVGSEMNFREIEALKAQAVVSRTYALWSIHQSPWDDFDLKDFEANQVYIGEIPTSPWYRDAAMITHGEILTWSGELILSAFSSTCGGKTANNDDVWSGRPLPYLRSIDDGDVCSISPHHKWEFSLTRDELNRILDERYGFRVNHTELEKDESGRVRTVIFKNSRDRELSFSGNEFRLMINRFKDPLSIRSTKFNWDEENGEIKISGGGLGHGVGMCQWGARGFAQNGWNYKDILSFYFSGTKIVNLHEIESNNIALHR